MSRKQVKKKLNIEMIEFIYLVANGVKCLLRAYISAVTFFATCKSMRWPQQKRVQHSELKLSLKKKTRKKDNDTSRFFKLEIRVALGPDYYEVMPPGPITPS